MDIAAGPYDVFVDGTKVTGIETADPDLNINTTDVTLLDGSTISRTTGRSAAIVFTVVDTGIDNLKTFLPDNWVAAATQIAGQATGTKSLTGGNGVINFGKPACGGAHLTVPIQLVPCDDPDQHTLTLWDGYAEITDISIEDTIMKYEITVRSEGTDVLLTKGGVVIPA